MGIFGYDYGQPLLLPSGFFSSTPAPTVTIQQPTLRYLRNTFSFLEPTPPRDPLIWPTFITPQLSLAAHVFVRRASICLPLVPAYDGFIFRIRHHGNEVTVDVNEITDVVAFQRMKPVSFNIVSPQQRSRGDPLIPTR